MSAWLMLAAGNRRQHGGNLGYDDDPQRRYAWDSTVANCERPKPGDTIALWDSDVLLGASVVDAITTEDGHKERLRCPGCTQTSFKSRAKTLPRYRCHNADCRLEFDTPVTEQIPVTTYATNHEAAWQDLYGLVDAATLRSLCVHPKSQQSIRELDSDAFRMALVDRGATSPARLLEVAEGRHIPGGHQQTLVRVRVGQGYFRRRLLDLYGSMCALSGPLPSDVLEAAHLYSYAQIGVHHEHGGLLLRRDLHRLFDIGLLAVHPVRLTVDVDPVLMPFPPYSTLHDAPLTVKVPRDVVRWLGIHWERSRAEKLLPGPDAAGAATALVKKAQA
jgi:hypothetical protein